MSTLNDNLDDLLSGERLPEPRQASPAYQPRDYSEPCPKCRGTGNFISYSGRIIGQCFTCKGAGKRSFKTSPETRAKARDASATKKANSIAEFKTAHQAAYEWIVASAPRNEFAASLLEKLHTYGDLTDGQLAAVENSLAKIEERKAAREANAPQADQDGIDRLKLAFDTAVAKSNAKGLNLRMPRITIGSMVISPAKANSKNPGALYVKSDGQYLGKINQGRFFAARECSAEQETKVLAFVADPKAAAEAYGMETGTCCICNAELKSEWKHRGIGPICAKKFGW